MDAAVLSAVSALAGSMIGAASSVITTLLTQRGQVRAQARSHEITKRELLYAEFIAEAAKRLGEALGREAESADVLVGLHAAIGRMRLISSRAVVAAAERVAQVVMQTYAAPNRTFIEFRDSMLIEDATDPLTDFGEACRAELNGLRGERA